MFSGEIPQLKPTILLGQRHLDLLDTHRSSKSRFLGAA